MSQTAYILAGITYYIVSIILIVLVLNLVNKKDITPLLKGRIDAVSISLNSSDPEIYLKNVRPVFMEKAFPAMLEFARNAAEFVPDVTMTTVATTITEEDEKKCRELCKTLGVNYRIRSFI